MAPTLGFTALLLIIFINIATPFFVFWQEKFSQQKINLTQITNIHVATSFALAITTQLCLIYSYTLSDYSILNVYQNSHHLKPLLYKISGSWGNHEGSMLLLITVMSFYNLIFTHLNKNNEYKTITICSQSLIIAGFAAFSAFTSNPFERLFVVPSEGLGLNPLLQDIGLALHPPMLYVGYLGFSITFSLAIAALLKEKITPEFAKTIQFWLFFSWGFLTLGIGLGSWWAYRELGWGGYWFWDPVENVSLMPWLTATALIHAAKLLKNQNICKIWTIFLALLNFILCLIGIFLTRSGLLTSVHSFAVDTKRGFFVILLIATIGGIAMSIFASKISKFQNPKKQKYNPLSKIGTIFINNYILLIALFAIFLGTLYPIFAQNFLGQSIAIGAKYYNNLFAILLFPFLTFLIISYFANYQNFIKKSKIFNWPNALIILASALITFFANKISSSANFSDLSLLFLTTNAAFLALFSKKTVSNLAHLGFTLLVVGIILSSLGSVKEINIKQGDTINVFDDKNYQLHFNRIDYKTGKNFLARVGIFTISKNGQELDRITPQLRYYPISNQTTNEASIKHGIFGDLYLAIGNKDDNDFYALRIYYKPFIYLIWLGCLTMSFAAFIKIAQFIFKKNNEDLLQIFYLFSPLFSNAAKRLRQWWQ